ncbi:MAG: TatD family hydrolase [Verrucomicrobiaceae bacterium]|nr:TatD family hydrolase [Verrucomicrobiaceae bacterium]
MPLTCARCNCRYERPMLIDTHCHLDHRYFKDDLADVLQRSREAGVTTWVAPATDIESTRDLIALAQSHEGLHACAGIHPCDAHSVSGSDWIQELRALAQTPGIAAIGEIGLDYYHKPPEGFDLPAWKAHQSEVLRAQLDLAVELGLNVILHARESQEDLVAAVQPYTGRLRAVFHCFTGTEAQAREVLALGHLVSFTGVTTFKNSPIIQATAQALSSGDFMLETDAPYLAPVPHRGKRCEPAFVADTARFIAQLRGEPVEELIATTTRTARAFFRGLD